MPRCFLTWPASPSPCTPSGPMSPPGSRPWRVAHPHAPGFLTSMPGIGVPAAAVFLAETRGRTSSHRGAAGLLRRTGTGDQEIGLIDLW